MSVNRLTFLYPRFFRTIRQREGCAAGLAAPTWSGNSRKRPPAEDQLTPRSWRRTPDAASYATVTSPRHSTFSRHGKAIEPQPSSKESSASPSPSPSPSPPEKQQAQQSSGPAIDKILPRDSSKIIKSKEEEGAKAQPPLQEARSQQQQLDNVQHDRAPLVTGHELVASTAAKNGADEATSSPMKAMLCVEPPRYAMPLSRPTYVHLFDTFSLVRHLEAGGFSTAQAITVMKAVRTLLAQNLGVAKAGLVSQSDVENESYLFRAACSELAAEVKNNRRVADEQTRQQRTLLHHEMDILTQTLNQESLTLTDNVRGMFNDRKMAVREEQRAAESAIQQINYKISVSLNSELRSEIETLRWVLIRRAVLGIIFMAVLTLGSLRYASYRSHEQAKKDAERLVRDADIAKMTSSILNENGQHHGSPLDVTGLAGVTSVQ